MAERDNIYDIQIIGAGPAGIGPLVAADRLEGLERFLQGRSVALINPDRRLGSGGLRGLKIKSNSPGDDFLEGISAQGDLSKALTTEAARIVAQAGPSALPLAWVADYLEELGTRIGYAVETSPGGAFIQEDVHDVFIRDDENGDLVFETSTYKNNKLKYLARSRSLIVATGAKEQLQDPVEYRVTDPTLYKYKSKTASSRSVLTEHAIPEIADNHSGRPVVILGGSHSAWSAAHKLIEQLGKSPDLTIDIFSRKGVKPFFGSATEAARAGYNFDPDDICPQTGRINRFLGIRGDARDLFLQVQSGQEGRVRLHQHRSTRDIEENLQQASVIVQGTGYKVNKLYLYDETRRFGTNVAGTSDSDYNCIDEQARILTDWGDVIPQAFGIGLGRSRLPIERIGGEPNARGKSVDGVNVYHGPIGELIIEGICAAGPRWI